MHLCISFCTAVILVPLVAQKLRVDCNPFKVFGSAQSLVIIYELFGGSDQRK